MTIPDMPDNYPFLPQSTRFPLADMGELAARLGSMVTYDRRGEVIWMDDMGTGSGKWIDTPYGAGASIKWVPGNVRMGHYAVEMIGGSDGVQLAQLKTYFPLFHLGRAGLELGVAFFTEFDKFELKLTRSDGTTRYRGSIRLDRTNSQIAYLDEDTNYQSIASLANPVNLYGVFHACKLVVDFNTNEYVRFLYNETEHDLSGIPLHKTDATTIASFRVALLLYSRSGQNDRANVDYVIITGNEP